MADLTQDLATATAHARDPITIGTTRYSREDAAEALGTRLATLLAMVDEHHNVPLGVSRGLWFGITLHPHGNPDVYIEGALTRFTQLSREFQGPRAIMNAVERLVGSYETEREKTARDLWIAQGQLRDFEARLGAGFAHAGYLDELTGLRNQLEAALSSNAQQVHDTPLPPTGEIVTRIKTLKAAHTLDATPERRGTRQIATMEEAVTTRIRHRSQVLPPPVPEDDSGPPADDPAPTSPLPAASVPARSSIAPLVEGARRSLSTPTRSRQEQAARPTWIPPRQLGLF